MPLIINDPKLDFKDVLLRPKRSTLKSRAEVDLVSSKRTYKGIPIIASNMDTVGTFEMAKVLADQPLFSTIHKHYTVEEWQAFVSGVDEKIFEHIAISSGASENDFGKVTGAGKF